MKKIIPLLFVLLTVYSCGNHKYKNNKLESPKQIVLTIKKYVPYCGGAAPNPLDIENKNHPAQGEFILLNKTDQSKTIIVTDQNGQIKLNLIIGRYAIRESYKNCSFEDFYKNQANKNSINYTEEKIDCYKNWWEKNLIEFEIVDSLNNYNLNTTIMSKCFTKKNPCITYTGPYPP